MDSSESVDKSIPGDPEIDQIEILGLIGSGGSGSVYRARQTLLDRIVAVKVPFQGSLLNEKVLTRFQQEARLSARLNHPHIVKTHGFGISRDGQPYLIQEYIQGAVLTDELRTGTPMKFGRFRQVFLPLLSALEHAHRAGVIHRDIKPDNILLDRSSSTEAVKLVDFGLAVLSEDASGAAVRMTQTRAAAGSAAYMSPEQCLGKPVDARTDIYSLCCVMYESLCGRLPFQGNSALEIMDKHATAALPTTSEFSRQMTMPESLSRLILSGLSKVPEKRPDAREFSHKLKKILDEVTLDRAPLLGRGLRPAGRKTLLTASICCFTIGAMGLASYGYYTRINSSNIIAHLSHPQMDDLTVSQLLNKIEKLDENGKGSEEFACWTAIFEHLAKSKKKRSPLYLGRAANAAYLSGHQATDAAVANNYFEKSLALCNEGIQLALKERKFDPFLVICVTKKQSLEGLGRTAELIKFTEDTVKQADLFDKETGISLKLQMIGDAFINEKPDLAESIVKKTLIECYGALPASSGQQLKVKIALVSVYQRKGLMNQAKALSMQIGRELIENQDILPSTRVDILSHFFSKTNDLEPAIRRNFAMNDLQKYDSFYRSDPFSKARLQHALALFSQDYFHDARESIAMEEQAVSSVRTIDSRTAYSLRREALNNLIQLCKKEHLTIKEKAYSEQLKQLMLLHAPM